MLFRSGISLSLWDYLFGTNYIPEEQNAQEILGFDGIEEFPKGFLKQLTYGFFNK